VRLKNQITNIEYPKMSPSRSFALRAWRSLRVHLFFRGQNILHTIRNIPDPEGIEFELKIGGANSPGMQSVKRMESGETNGVRFFFVILKGSNSSIKLISFKNDIDFDERFGL
jgi:hypothetical protein